MLINESRLAIKMCSGACKNSTSNSLLDKLNNTDEEYAFDDELERVVSQTVFLLFGVIGIAGLVGNALVVLGESSNLIILNTLLGNLFLYIRITFTLIILLLFSGCCKSFNEINNEHSDY